MPTGNGIRPPLWAEPPGQHRLSPGATRQQGGRMDTINLPDPLRQRLADERIVLLDGP
ncbi:MAG: hypothetical protein R2742_06675 [Micropruina glycogenica]